MRKKYYTTFHLSAELIVTDSDIQIHASEYHQTNKKLC